MKILVISQTVWSNENNSGNTLSNFFYDFDAKFAHIYFSEGRPNNKICNSYYQVTDKMVLKGIFRKVKVGISFDSSSYVEEESFEMKIKKINNFYTQMLREIIWKCTKVDTQEMYNFIESFNPDIIYAPCYGNLRMNRIIQSISKRLNVPIISFVSDDIYNFGLEMRNPLKVIYYAILRISLRKTFKLYKFVFTLTDEQKTEYSELFNVTMGVIKKSGEPCRLTKCCEPFRIIYAGGVYLGRDEILVNLVSIIKEINDRSVHKKVFLDIYSDGKIDEYKMSVLNNGVDSHFNQAISYQQLKKEYIKSCVSLHVESFKQINVEYTKLSFSTKIVDCLQSGSAVLAISPASNAGFKYLKKEDAAMCVDNINELQSKLEELLNDLPKYQELAKKCLLKNHNGMKNKEILWGKFNEIIQMKYTGKE